MSLRCFRKLYNDFMPKQIHGMRFVTAAGGAVFALKHKDYVEEQMTLNGHRIV